MNYYDYIQSKEWRLIRGRKLLEDKNKCSRCDCRTELDVHHLTYERLGHERMEDLTTLCRRCHRDLHYFQDRQTATQEMVRLHEPYTESDFESVRKMYG